MVTPSVPSVPVLGSHPVKVWWDFENVAPKSVMMLEMDVPNSNIFTYIPPLLSHPCPMVPTGWVPEELMTALYFFTSQWAVSSVSTVRSHALTPCPSSLMYFTSP